MKINISTEDLLVIDQALQNLPFRQVAPVINRINAELKKIHDKEFDKQEEIDESKIIGE